MLSLLVQYCVLMQICCLKKKGKANEVFKALEELGFSLIKDGIISEDLLKIVAQPLISENDCRERLSKE